MSEPIQSIAQNNYILHNIDAKKLYVQEPLFTANSGDAVYVGWRPDETVLWSGNATSAVNLSEDLNNFERIKIEYGPDSPEWHEYKAGDSIKVHEMLKAGGTSATYWIGNITLLFSGTNIKVMTAYCWDFKNTMSYTTAYNTYALNSIRKVIGINRKENA